MHHPPSHFLPEASKNGTKILPYSKKKSTPKKGAINLLQKKLQNITL